MTKRRPAAFDYRLGNRSALDWVIDQYQVKTDKRRGITSDPNAYSEKERYIVDLVGRVIAVSVETVEIVNALAALPFRAAGEGGVQFCLNNLDRNSLLS